MKTIYKSLILLFAFITLSAQSQIVNEQKSTDIVIAKSNENNTYQKKIVKHETQTLKLESDDQGKLNQNIDKTPIKVSKKILIDQDSDGEYDKEFSLLYTRNKKELNSKITKDNLIIYDDNNSKISITEEGVYEISTNYIKNIDVRVDDLTK